MGMIFLGVSFVLLYLKGNCISKKMIVANGGLLLAGFPFARGYDFVFIVREERIKAVCEKLLGNFETVKNMFIDKADIAAGGIFGKDRQGRKERFDLLSISIAVVVNSSTRKFKHYGEVSEAASQLKSYVKSLMGSNYVIDRRN